MSEPVLALGGAVAPARTTVTELAAPGMITLRADLAACGDVVAEALGLMLPGPRGITGAQARRLAWMAPDELLVMVPREAVTQTLATLTATLQGRHHLVQDVSDMRALFAVTGAAPRDVLAKLVPADMHGESFAQGEIRRTRLAQIPCAFWLEEDGARVICFRSVAQYAFDVLAGAAADDAQVGFFDAI